MCKVRLDSNRTVVPDRRRAAALSTARLQAAALSAHRHPSAHRKPLLRYRIVASLYRKPAVTHDR
jgi:hypothetical protein